MDRRHASTAAFRQWVVLSVSIIATACGWGGVRTVRYSAVGLGLAVRYSAVGLGLTAFACLAAPLPI